MDQRFPVGTRYMLDNQLLCDVTFIAGAPRQEVRAHRVILASSSVVFEAMFCGPLAHGGDSIITPDIDGDVLMELFRYIYTKKCDIRSDNVANLAYAAKKYVVDDLFSDCVQFLHKAINIDNVITVLQIAYVFDVKSLFEGGLVFMYTQGHQALQASGEAEFTPKVVEFLLSQTMLNAEECIQKCRDVLSLTEESSIVQGTKNVFCNNYVMNVLFLVRTPFLPFSVFLKIVSPQCVLSKVDRDIVLKAVKLNEQLRSAFFRQHINEKHIIYLGNIAEPRGGEDNSFFSNATQLLHETVIFSCSESVSLAGFSLYAPIAKGSCYVDIEVKDKTEHALPLAVVKTKLVHKPGVSHVDVLFQEPIKIVESTDHVITLTCAGIETFMGTPLADISSNDEVTISFRSQRCSVDNLVVSDSQIRGILVII